MSLLYTFFRKGRSVCIWLQKVWWSFFYTLYLRLHPRVSLGKSLTVSGRMHWIIDPNGTVKIGNNVRINSGLAINAFGGHRRMIVCVLPSGKLVIGNGVGLSSSTLVCKNYIEIKQNAMVGGACDIVDTDFHPIDSAQRLCRDTKGIRSAPIEIGENAWVGGRVLILKGVAIGSEAVIGAGSVVTRSIPAGQIWAGNPVQQLASLASRANSYET